MRYMQLIIIGLAAVTLLYFGVFKREPPQGGNRNESDASQQRNPPVGVAQSNWETQTNEELPVTIKVTPIELGKGAETWKFEIVLNTHSGSLDDDLLTAAYLMDDKGNTYQPTTWEGPGPGGHHREGVLVFEAVYPAPPFIELKIKNVGGISERSFKWDLK